MKVLVFYPDQNILQAWSLKLNKCQHENIQYDYCSNEKEMQRYIFQKSYDLILIDPVLYIQYQQILTQKKYFIILISQSFSYVQFAFQMKVFSYLQLDMSDQQIKTVMNKVLHEAKKKKAKCFLYTYRCCRSFFPEEILYIETYYHQTRVMTEKGMFEGKIKNLKKMKKVLKEFGFLQIHQNYFINMAKLVSIKKGEVTLCNGDEIPTSIQKRNYIHHEIQMFLKRQ